MFFLNSRGTERRRTIRPIPKLHSSRRHQAAAAAAADPPMEGVGARLGRSSSRYGTTTVFTGPVRKWKKKWVHVTPSSSSSSSSSSSTAAAAAGSSSNSNRLHPSLPNGSINGSNNINGSHLLLLKWTPISYSNDGDGGEKNSNKDDTPQEPKRRKYKYIPIAVLEEQKKESEETTDDDEKLTDNGTTPEPTSKSGSLSEKPDINDIPMEESQDSEQNQTRQDLNVSTLDLSLGLSSHEAGHNSSSRMK